MRVRESWGGIGVRVRGCVIGEGEGWCKGQC